MKLDTAIVISKGAAYTLTGFFAPWSAALAQWQNSETWPPKIAWVILLTISISSACTSWLAFCSGSWKEYRQQKLANDSGQDVVETVEPQSSAEKPKAQT